MWDPRPVQWPKLTPSMFRTIRAWVDENARAWDTHVQVRIRANPNPNPNPNPDPNPNPNPNPTPNPNPNLT